MEKTENKDRSKYFSRLLYCVMVLVAIINLVFLKSLSGATTAFALALAFDPFNPSQQWSLRPLWQKTWLIVHLALAIGMLGLLLSGWSF